MSEENFPLDENLIPEEETSIQAVQDTLESFLEAASIDVVYGEPVENAGQLIIPTAEVIAGLGFGMGYGYGSGESPDDEEGRMTGSGAGGGGGGGGKIISRPVAVVISSSEGVRVEPVVDATKIAIAALTAFGFMAAMVMRMLQPEKALKEMKMD